MKIISWNLNGIRAVHKKGLFTEFVEKLSPDIACFQETKAQEEQSEVDLPDYTEYWNSAVKKGYSGTAIFNNDKTVDSPISITKDFPNKIVKKYSLADKYGDPNTEGRVITAEYEAFYLVTVYTPNSKDDLSRIPLRHLGWDPAFLEYMKQLDKKKPVVFCGDLNVAHTEDDLSRPKDNVGKKGFTNEEREGLQKFINAGFVDTFRMFTVGNGHYTWWSHFANARERNIGWRIDYIFVSERIKNKVKSAQIHPTVLGSDHCPVSVEIVI